MKQYEELASQIIKHVGGKDNIRSVRHCYTRLRFKLHDEKQANDTVLKDLEGVITIVKSGGEYMVVIGEQVPFVYEEVCRQIGVEIEKKEEITEDHRAFPALLQRDFYRVQG